jgi:ribosomal protein L28
MSKIKKKYQFKKFVKVKKITIKRTMIRSDRKKPEEGNRKSILKIISNKTNNNKKKWELNLINKRLKADEIEKKI